MSTWYERVESKRWFNIQQDVLFSILGSWEFWPQSGVWGSTRFVEGNLSTSDRSQSWSVPAKLKHTEKHVTSNPAICQTIGKEKLQILFHLCRWFHSFEAWWYTSADPAWGKVNICFCRYDWTSIQINMFFSFSINFSKDGQMHNAFRRLNSFAFLSFELHQQNKSKFDVAWFCLVGLV